ncbi:hypothetical protein N7471_010597 [Penicillium samsonianum]|uniref:uncharacterized protein n=1 Tax=Penicillium samsonianum TaxID=1882272 RepID=UPI0025490AAD|nr:uncharacterized protein N7471_010597 [Penicillium samsonianum]KAJ6126104.1 hypothetical protein N7471_010597 [Penicillium samsonianum]
MLLWTVGPSPVASDVQIGEDSNYRTYQETEELYEQNYYSLMPILDGLCKYIAVGSSTFRDFAASSTVTPASMILPEPQFRFIPPALRSASWESVPPSPYSRVQTARRVGAAVATSAVPNYNYFPA